MIPPLWMSLRISGKKRRRLEVPLLLLYPILLAIFTLALPVVLVAAILSGRLRWMGSLLFSSAQVLTSLRGLEVNLRSDINLFKLSFR